MIYPHEKNLDGKIAKATPGSPKAVDLTNLKTLYTAYRTAMQSINYAAKNIVDYNVAANEMDQYLVQVEGVINRNGLKAQDKLRSTVLEELSVYMFENYPAIAAGTMEIFNKRVYAGVVVDRTLTYKIQPKDVDFCIGKETQMTINGNSKRVRFPFICVEAKTYVDATMNHEILFSGTQIKTASPEAKTFLLQEYEDEIGANHPIPASYNYAIDKRFNLRDCKRPSGGAGVTVTPISGQHLLEYYTELESCL